MRRKTLVNMPPSHRTRVATQRRRQTGSGGMAWRGRWRKCGKHHTPSQRPLAGKIILAVPQDSALRADSMTGFTDSSVIRRRPSLTDSLDAVDPCHPRSGHPAAAELGEGGPGKDGRTSPGSAPRQTAASRREQWSPRALLGMPDSRRESSTRQVPDHAAHRRSDKRGLALWFA